MKLERYSSLLPEIENMNIVPIPLQSIQGLDVGTRIGIVDASKNRLVNEGGPVWWLTEIIGHPTVDTVQLNIISSTYHHVVGRTRQFRTTHSNLDSNMYYMYVHIVQSPKDRFHIIDL